jgi:thymidylate synthase ThyX
MFLPIGTKTEIVITANLREWNTIFGLRAEKYAHPIMRDLATRVLTQFYRRIPKVYGPVYRCVTPLEDLTPTELKEEWKAVNKTFDAMAERREAIADIMLGAEYDEKS